MTEDYALYEQLKEKNDHLLLYKELNTNKPLREKFEAIETILKKHSLYVTLEVIRRARSNRNARSNRKRTQITAFVLPLDGSVIGNNIKNNIKMQTGYAANRRFGSKRSHIVGDSGSDTGVVPENNNSYKYDLGGEFRFTILERADGSSLRHVFLPSGCIGDIIRDTLQDDNDTLEELKSAAKHFLKSAHPIYESIYEKEKKRQKKRRSRIQEHNEQRNGDLKLLYEELQTNTELEAQFEVIETTLEKNGLYITLEVYRRDKLPEGNTMRVQITAKILAVDGSPISKTIEAQTACAACAKFGIRAEAAHGGSDSSVVPEHNGSYELVRGGCMFIIHNHRIHGKIRIHTFQDGCMGEIIGQLEGLEQLNSNVKRFLESAVETLKK